MAKRKVSFDVENSTRNTSIQVQKIQLLSDPKRRDEHETNEGAHNELPINLYVRGLTFLVSWKTIFAISCTFGVLVDPLFFYIPFVNKNLKCFELDKKLKTVALVSRLLTDFMYVIDIILHIWIVILAKRRISVISNPLKMLAKWAWKSYIIMDILAVLPAPQVLTFILLPKMRGSSSLLAKEFMTTLALLQYVPRVVCIYISCKEFNMSPTRTETGIWIFFKGGFSVFLYILTSHVLGAFWYFLAMQRESTCWQLACQSDQNGCKTSTFYCNDRLFQNLTTLNDLCPINPSDAKVFDFGIFLDALQSGVVESTDFPRKILHCFWWGLRNLSSLGSNLETSSNAMENLFAVFISLFGLLLFIFYLSGNLQQIWTHRASKSSAKRKVLRQMESKALEIQCWLSENRIPKPMKKGMMQRLQIHLEKENNFDVNMKNIISIVTLKDKRLIKRYLCWSTLRKVPMFQTLDEEVLQIICQSLTPVMFTEDTYIVKEGEPLVKMLFIIQGTVWSYGSSSNKGCTRCLKKGDFYGEELLNWVSEGSSFTGLPTSTRFVKSHTKVEAFVLMASDLKTIVCKSWLDFVKVAPPSQKQHLAASSIQESWHQHRERKARAKHHAQLKEMWEKITDEVPLPGHSKWFDLLNFKWLN